MHEYISEFTRLVGHAYKIKPTDIGSHLLATQFIQGITSLHIKNKLGFLMSKNEIRTLSDLFASALQDDQKQKTKEKLIWAHKIHNVKSMPLRAEDAMNVVKRTT